MKYFWTGDWHYNHRRIIEFCKRPFKNIKDHDEALIYNCNRVVGPKDLLTVVGDLSPYRRNIEFVLDKLVCKSIIYIVGNHDPVRNNGLPERWFADMFPLGCYQNLMMTVYNQKIWVSHYAHKVWPKSHRGAYHLFGHSHNNLIDDPHALSMDCGVDSAAAKFGGRPEDYRPFSFDEVKQFMSTKSFKPIDHHS